jgi:hypothetical protein
MENFKIVIKPIKPKVIELDPVKIKALKEKRKLQREMRKGKPKKEPITKPDYSDDLEKINKNLKKLVGLSVEEINDKLKLVKV